MDFVRKCESHRIGSFVLVMSEFRGEMGEDWRGDNKEIKNNSNYSAFLTVNFELFLDFAGK